MVEMRDGKKAFDERDMKLAFMYAVPDNIQEEEKRMKEQKEDAEVERFKALYLNPRAVEEIPQDVIEDTQKETQKEEEEEAPPPRVPMAVYEKEIKDEDGKLNYDRVEDIVRRYQSDVMSRTKTVDPTAEEKQIRQFTSRAIQISKGMYLKTDTPVGGNIDPALNTFVETSSEDDSDKEVISYLNELSEKERTLLLQKLQEQEGEPRRRHKHKHTSHHRRRSH
ncbi:hypothetical protein AV274_1587 [Blastocystis sp. ATCC 50177/Nand II]|uniref:Uncharacterized protein n=1 Tax=Blastocystis sp. subtype 1 (strain ATCC 50177 / NandII) TaxID=478820 RepID=A0A196SI13_BLAHN|nr:hypothetical protein AV274_1587 [Blastocystis sp. ATCC 50177/Nand II]